MQLSVLHQDDDLVVVDKPARLLVVPAPGRKGDTVVSVLGRQLGQRIYAVHRLDEDTTGALLLARNQETKRSLEELFRRHAVDRRYLAVVSRVPDPRAGRVESLLAEDRRGSVRSVERGGQRAVTRYRTLARHPEGALVECRLETGRRNQIRVHMAELGCPVVGDRKYGLRPSAKAGRRPRAALLLHAATLTLDHPRDGQRLEVHAPCAWAETGEN